LESVVAILFVHVSLLNTIEPFELSYNNLSKPAQMKFLAFS